MKLNAKREPIMLTAMETAFRLGISEQHVRDLINEGKIHAIDVGGASRHFWRIPVTALERFKKEKASI